MRMMEIKQNGNYKLTGCNFYDPKQDNRVVIVEIVEFGKMTAEQAELYKRNYDYDINSNDTVVFYQFIRGLYETYCLTTSDFFEVAEQI